MSDKPTRYISYPLQLTQDIIDELVKEANKRKLLRIDSSTPSALARLAIREFLDNKKQRYPFKPEESNAPGID